MAGCETPSKVASAAFLMEGYTEVSLVFKSRTLKDVPLCSLILAFMDSERKDLPDLAKVYKALVFSLQVLPKLGLFIPLFARLINFFSFFSMFTPFSWGTHF